MAKSSDLNLVGYCGVFCGACAWCNRKWRKPARELIVLLEAYPPMPWEGELDFDYEDFEKGLKWLHKKRYVCLGCRSDERPTCCEIRDCARSKQIDFCYQREDFPCEKLVKIQKDHPHNVDNIRRIRETRVEEWIQEQERRAEAGHIHHVKERMPL